MNTFTALCTNAAKQKTHPRCQQSLTLKGRDWGVWLPDLNHPAEHVQRELAHLRALVVLNSVICHDCWLAENGADEEDAPAYPPTRRTS